jgi:predicted ATPase/DNA-binding winged helix-turn-helix (wHTH) protein
MIYAFEEYELDGDLYELRYAGKLVRLEPQVFNVLAYLIQHRDRLVTKEELLEQLWPGRFVSEATLTSRLTAARRAVGDRGRAQRVIQTIHGRGYRFILPVEELSARKRASHQVPAALASTLTPSKELRAPRAVQAVGRKAELAQLHQWLQHALCGTRRVAFVTGEAGLGKTTLVGAFLQELGDDGALWIGRGQCIEHYGTGEAYLPVLEALSRLCREPSGQELMALLVRQAPTWVVQMPWLISDTELEALQRRVTGATQERMLREMAEALAIVTAARPLVLVLEDLHWSDPSTLSLIAWLARRHEPARLLVLGTYRPADVSQPSHPLHAVVHELKLHHRCDELALTWLTEGAVEEYLTARFPGTAMPVGLARLVCQRTEGNPLFMVAVVDAWEAQGWLEEVAGVRRLRLGLDELAQGVPESLRQMLAGELARLSVDDQRILEAASVVGVEFSAAAVAAGLELDVVEAETRCEGLVRQQQWLRAIGGETWPDGTTAGRYAFIHALYQNVVYQRVPPARCIHLHRCIGVSKEMAYGTRAGEIAAELAVHFERGRDQGRAVQYLQQAAETASRRHAHREAIEYLRRALALLEATPDTPERIRQELAVQLTLGPALMVTRGFAAPEVADTYGRALQLCEQLGDRQRLFPALFGLWRSAHVRAQLPTARALGEQILLVAAAQADPARCVEAHAALGQTLCIQGELILAREHLQQVVVVDEPQHHTAMAFRFGYDPVVYARVMEGWTLWLLGYPEQALRHSQDTLTRARAQAHPFTLALTLVTAAVVHQLRQEADATLEHVQASLALSTQHGFPYLGAIATVRYGWGLARLGQVDEGIAHMRQGLAAVRATGTELSQPYHLALLAEAYGRGGQIEAGLCALEEALVVADQHAERLYEAELQRLKGELLLRKRMTAGFIPAPTALENGPSSRVGAASQLSLQTQAQACFQTALDLARRQQAKSLELRAATSLSRLWQRQGKRQEAYDLLTPIYGWFTEGFDTADLQEAKALLDELS